MTRSSKATVATTVILIISAVLIVVAALIGTKEEIVYVDSYDYKPADHLPGAAVVVSKTAREGTTIFWIQFQEPEYTANVYFTVPGECGTALGDQEAWPISAAGCDGPDRVEGSIGGLGRSAEGETMVNVAMSVSEECYAAVELGTDWSTTAGTCP